MKEPHRRTIDRTARALAAAALLAGCTPPPEPARPPAPAPRPAAPAPSVTAAPAPPERELPPEPGPARELTLPAPSWDELANGLKVATVPSASLPIVHVRAVALAGSASDGDRPGVAALTAQLLKEGGAGGMSSRELLARAEAMGASLEVETTLDRTTLSIAVTKDLLAEALDLLAAVTQRPAMGADELGKLRKRLSDEAADLSRTDPAWGAERMIYRGLFGGGAAPHPYATRGATATEIGKLTAGDCRAFHKRVFAPKNMLLAVAGDVTPAEVKAAADKAFGAAPSAEAPALTFAAPKVPDHLQITLIDRPKSTQSDLFAAVLGPERASPEWPAFAAANQILGGLTGRLFAEVRERDGLAYRAGSALHELSRGPSLLVAHAGTRSSKTGLTAKALLDQLERLGTTEPTAAEVAVATRFLADVTAIRLEGAGALADELVKDRTLGLPDDYPVKYRKQIREVSAESAARAAAAHVRSARAVLVVVGDAAVAGPMLRRFGEVKVVDPMKDFALRETLAPDPTAALEAPEEAGK